MGGSVAAAGCVPSVVHPAARVLVLRVLVLRVLVLRVLVLQVHGSGLER